MDIQGLTMKSIPESALIKAVKQNNFFYCPVTVKKVTDTSDLPECFHTQILSSGNNGYLFPFIYVLVGKMDLKQS